MFRQTIALCIKIQQPYLNEASPSAHLGVAIQGYLAKTTQGHLTKEVANALHWPIKYLQGADFMVYFVT